MNTASIVIRTNPEEKAKAQETVREWGVNLSAVFKEVLHHLSTTKSKTFKFSARKLEEYPNAKTRRLLKQAEEHLKEGKGSPLFTSDAELLKKYPDKYWDIRKMEDWFAQQGI